MDRGIIEMLEYNKWANAQLFEFARTLTDEQLDTQPAARAAVRELLTHIAGGQQTFVLRTQGRQHEGELTRASEWPGIDELIAVVTTTSEDLIDIARRTDQDDEVDLPYMGRMWRYPVRFFLVHANEHGIEHRTEVKIALEAMGLETPNLDAWAYSMDVGYGADPNA